jgi:hypothetical protein
MSLRVYLINRETGYRREIRVEEYELAGPVNPFGSQVLPPCSCPRCIPRSVRESAS